MTDETAPSRKVRAIKRTSWAMTALFGAGLLVTLGTPLASPLFPEEEAITCTVTHHSALGRRRGVFPHVDSDCGGFRSGKSTVCTADPALRVNLIPGSTYDFVVRGAHIPLVQSRELVSAAVSKTQPDQRDEGNTQRFTEDTADLPGSEEFRARIAELEAQFSPETLRAFDYEQPPYSPACDVTRNVMTIQGLQLVSPDKAAELLRTPTDTTARNPKLPCEGYLCERINIG